MPTMRWVAVDELADYRVRRNAIAVIMKAIAANADWLRQSIRT
jgi:hypothetical protein